MRTVMLASGLLALSAGVSGAVEPQDATLLGRMGYGHDNWSRQRLADLGRREYVLEQLNPESIPDPVIRQALREAQFDALPLSFEQLLDTFGPSKAKRPAAQALRQVQAEMVLRAIQGRRQLETLMTEFWANHFNVDLSGSVSPYQVTYMRDTIRPRVFAKFEDLLLAVAKAPAMLKYLNNDMSFKDGYVLGGRARGLNENYARELMELHCFGVDDQAGVYTQRDVTEMARALTGWTIDRQSTTDGFEFLAAGHDSGAKRVIGLNLPAGGGLGEGERAVRYLANHWRTRNFITRKLVDFFVPPGIDKRALVTRAREVWKDTGGNIRAVLRTILLRGEVAQRTGSEVLRPLQLIASSARSVNAQLGVGADRFSILVKLVNGSQAMGQPLLHVPPPTGWDDADASWANAALMLERFNALNAWYGPGGQIPVGFQPRGSVDAMLDLVEARVLGAGELGAASRTAIRNLLIKTAVSGEDRYRLCLAHVLSSAAFNRN